MSTEHTASRNADALAREAPHLLAPTPAPTQRHRALEEIVSLSWEIGLPDEGAVARIRELARLLHRLEPMDEKRWTIVDDDPARANETRAHAALMAVAAFPLGGGYDLTNRDDLETVAADLVCDLLHLVDRAGGSPGNVVAKAEMHFEEEKLGL